MVLPHEKIPQSLSRKLVALNDKFTLLFSFDLMDNLTTDDVCPETGFSCSPNFHIVRSGSRNYPAGIITIVIISLKQHCPKTGCLQAAILRFSLGSKMFVDISPGLSQNRSFDLQLPDKFRTILVQKVQFVIFSCKF